MNEEGLKEMQRLAEKMLGKGVGKPLSDREFEPVNFLSTGSMLADWVMGGGIPRGRITELYGPESGGKSTLALCTVAQVQKAGGRAAWIDQEFAYNGEWAEKLGVDTNALYLEQFDTGEEALTFAELIVKSNAFDICVIDSVSGLTPRAEIEGEMSDAVVGVQARLMSKGCRKLAPYVNKTNTSLVFVNQIREKIGVMFGSPETTSGGRALRHYSSLRVDVRRGELIKDKDETTGHLMKLTTKKSRHGGFNRSLLVPLNYDTGLDAAREIAEYGPKAGVFDKTGSWYSFNGEKIGQGVQQAADWVREHPEMIPASARDVMDYLNRGGR